MKIPIILIGETGSGKFSLIEMLSKLINKESDIYKMSCHVGTTDEDIINFMKNINYKIKSKLNKINDKKEEEVSIPKLLFSFTQINFDNHNKNQYEINDGLIWVFFDEINTCNSLGLLTEILVKNSIYGKPLDKRIIFVASCNPYRLLSEKNSTNIFYKKQIKNNLVYKVNPLPFTLLNFVFNFGDLKKEDEEKYIRIIVKEYLNQFFLENNKNDDKDLCDKIISIGSQSVILCHNFLKEINQIHKVNLKDINKFLKFFDYFSKFLFFRKNELFSINNNIKNNEIIKFYKDKTDFDIYYNQ